MICIVDDTEKIIIRVSLPSHNPDVRVVLESIGSGAGVLIRIGQTVATVSASQLLNSAALLLDANHAIR